ncbi:hypothetical protein Mapa_013779 [Marchantia paleacea]|nr:hypothetical protein Mapa_013779 [Marchantia paleacea]
MIPVLQERTLAMAKHRISARSRLTRPRAQGLVYSTSGLSSIGFPAAKARSLVCAREGMESSRLGLHVPSSPRCSLFPTNLTSTQ